MLRLTDKAVAEGAVVAADAGTKLSWGKLAVFTKLHARSRPARALAGARLRGAAAEKCGKNEAEQESHAAILVRGNPPDQFVASFKVKESQWLKPHRLLIEYDPLIWSK